MSKMFYSLEEAAEKLGCDTSGVKALVDEGKLQPYLDGKKQLFKVDQVDQVASQGGGGGGAADSDAISIEEFDDEPIGMSEDKIDLADGDSGDAKEPGESATASSINLLDAQDLGADESEKTQLSDSFNADASDLSLDAIGSGSGLLDLTQESDDTSLGSVELLDDAPSDSGLSSGLGSDLKMGESSDVLAGSSTGIFDAVGGAESSAAAPMPGESFEDEDELAPVAYDSGESDGFPAGMLAGTFIVLVVGLIVALPGVRGVATGIAETLASGAYGMYYGALAGLCIVLGVVGMFVSRR